MTLRLREQPGNEKESHRLAFNKYREQYLPENMVKKLQLEKVNTMDSKFGLE